MALEDLGLRRAAEAMASYPHIDKDYSLSEVLKQMDKAKTDRVMLTEDGVLRGIVTLRDILFKLGTVRTKQVSPSALHASSFMSEPVVSVGEEDTLLKAVSEMDKGGFTSIPVTREGEPVGMITRYELARLIAESPRASDISVRDVMRTPKVSVGLQARILHVRQLIQQHDMSVIPVVEDGRMAGVIGVDELATVFIKYYELARGEPKRITPLKYVVVADAIRLRPPRVGPESSLAEAADLMARTRYRAVVVVDQDKPVGIVTGLELARAILRVGG
ncbi:MAG: CBS domain-containing protein [Desulfurococcales archaeon]|nr:CBS domain-containing protein [Desulfurococcales archaeon]